MRFQGFIGPSYTLGSKNVDAQRCINMYPELNELGTGKEREIASLVSTPGLELIEILGDGPVRGLHAGSNGVLYVVSGHLLYSVDSDFIPNHIGTLKTGYGNVSMQDNGMILVVVDGDNGYHHTLGTQETTQIEDEAFLGSRQVAYQDGYFIFSKPDSGIFYIAGLGSIDFDALDFASAEGLPDNITGILCDHRELWLFGEVSTEVFYNTGAAAFPFQRVEGSFIEHGCVATFSISKLNNTVYWLGRNEQGDGVVWAAEGYAPRRISTHSVERAMQKYGDLSEATAWTYQENGHSFYALNFEQNDTTWVFDTASGQWHERAFTENGRLHRHRVNNHAFFAGKHVVGDFENGNLYEMSETIYSDNGSEITRRRVSPHITETLDRLFYSNFQLDIETGVGVDGTGQGVTPQAMLQWSDDGGHTWSNEYWRSFGEIGVRYKRAIWRRLGQSRDRIFRVTITDPVKVALIGAELDVAKGAS